MDYNVKWLKDLSQGQLGEKMISYKLKQLNFEIKNFNDNSDYDILTLYKGKEIKFEAKTDLYEFYKNITTNNMFIELLCNGKMSGLNTTKADVFVYYYPQHELLYMIKMDKLREIIKGGGLVRSTQSGDKGKVTGYLINRIEMADQFKIIEMKGSRKVFGLE